MRALALAALLAAAPAAAQTVPVRTGEHPGHGRIVFDWPSAPPYRVEQEGERVRLRFPPGAEIALPRRLPRNMQAIRRDGEVVEVTIAPGARIRHFRSGAKVALDVLDAAPAAPAPRAPVVARRSEPREAPPPTPSQPAAPAAQPQPAERAAPSPSPAAAPSPEGAAAPPRLSAAPAVPLPAPAPVVLPAAPPPAVAIAPPPAADGLRVLPGPAAGPPGLRLLRAGAAGIALFPRGDRMVLALETEQPFDLSRLSGHPHWPVAEARRLAGGAALIVPLPPGLAPAVLRQGGDLLVEFRPAAGTPPAELTFAEGRAQIAAAAPGSVLVLNDPLTELPLLVGTHRDGGQRQPLARSWPEFEVLPSFAGAVLLARSDRLTLRPGPGRFVAALEGGALAAGGAAPERLVAGAAMTRFLDLPAQPVPALLERLRADQAAVAQTPPLSRAPARLQAAQGFLALGLPQEAAAQLRLAAAETPEAAQAPRHRALAGIAALLLGEGGQGLEAPLPESDELSFWRGLRAARAGDPRAAAPALASTLPLLLSYPEGLRRRLLAPVAEALAEGGDPAGARRLAEAAGEEVPMHMALALAEEAEGNADRALEALEAAANGRDRRTRARALRRAAELRLATGRLDPAGAARALDAALFAWRGDEEELALRRRIAQLRQEGGDARGAIAMLREAEAAFPESAAALRPGIQSAFLQALGNEPPMQAVALHDAHPELVPADAAGEAALAALAERLVALDLPERGGALLRRAMDRMPPGEARAALGLRLATLRLGERDAAGALEALAASGAPAISAPLLRERAVLAARAEARRGNRAVAAEALAALGPAGDEALAEILTEGRDFAAAAAALGRHLAALAPPQGPLPEPVQRVALRQAALLALAGDERGVGTLRAAYAARFPAGALAHGFEALTADPVRGLADLPRMARELNLFRGLGQWREPLRTAALPTG
ncbi:hypothetical protein ACI6QG_11505 [Roseococcus sp. DSY-14]|uniref:hypothetical protein n=1 Tax=Roseococcus sp. DSY-14 TaxID=3369650 RepID=UPI00387B8FE3